MKYLSLLASSINNMLNTLYGNLTAFFQGIDLDSKLAFLCKHHLLISFVVFALLLAYFVFRDEKESYHSFEDPKNIVVFLIFLPVYTFFSNKSIDLSSLGLGSISVHAFILIIIAKLYGPLMAGAFGAAEYILFYLDSSGDILMTSMFFIYAIGGMLHGWILYEHKTSFWRCLLARLVTVILCNVILISLVRAGVYTHASPLSVFIPQTITTNIIQVPVQAFIGYIALLFIKFMRIKFDVNL